MKGLLTLVWAGWLAACASPGALPPSPPLPGQGEALHVIYVVSFGWHAGIAVAREDLAASGLVPEAVDFPRAAFIEFGWGDREFYRARKPTLGMALAAALLPTPAVLHVAGLERPPQEAYPAAEVVALPLGAAALKALIGRVGASFDRAGKERAEAIGPGLYFESLFYPAHGKFHLFNTCNTWAARKLSAARPDISPWGVMTAGDLMRRVRALAGARPVKIEPLR